MLVAIFAALAAGASFAIGGVLQQRAASRRPEGEALSFRLIFSLAHDPSWLLGIAFALASYILEGIALSFGPLVLVQPLLVSELLFALPISLRWRGTRMSLREWAGTLAVTVGLCAGLVSAAPRQGRPEAPALAWTVALGIICCLTLAALWFGRRARSIRASLYALGAGLILGTQAALMKAAISHFKHSLMSGLESWELWAMIAAAIIALLLVQSAYESGPLATSMPVVDGVDPSVSIAFGIFLFHERIHQGLRLAGVGAGLLLLLGGIVLLDTSPLIHGLQKVERRERKPLRSGK